MKLITIRTTILITLLFIICYAIFQRDALASDPSSTPAPTPSPAPTPAPCTSTFDLPLVTHWNGEKNEWEYLATGIRNDLKIPQISYAYYQFGNIWPYPPDFEKYEPKVSEKIDRTANSVSGYKNYEYVLIPRYPGLQKIKPVMFSYFHVSAKKYKLLRTPEIIVNVEKGSDEFMTVTSGLSKEEVKLLGKDIRFIQLSNVQFDKIGSFFYKKFYFLLIVLLPILIVAFSLGYRRHLDKLSGNIAYARSRKANQMAMKRLHKAKKLLSEKTQKEFYAEISNSLMGFLGDKFNIAAAGIITDEVEELMRTRGVDESVVKKYLSCLHVCDYQRFAPSNAKLDEMKKFFDHAKQAIVALEKVI